MGFLTPSATVVWRLAEREAELLDQRPGSAHALVALIWEGSGAAAITLRGLGLADAEEIRARLRHDNGSVALGMDLHSLMVAAAREADALGQGFVGTEHQLLAITEDALLSTDVLGEALREGVRERVRAIMRSPGYNGRDEEQSA